MKVFFILDDEVLYHPSMLENILNKGNYCWVGVGISTKKPLRKYLMRHIRDIGIKSVLKLTMKEFSLKLYSKLFFPITNVPKIIRDIAKKYNVIYIYVDNVNDEEFLTKLKSLEPDVIVSSNSQIFKEKLLSLPKKICINRHSGLLPSYGGLLPVFQAIAHGENEIGVTIHAMDKGLDTGRVITQKSISLNIKNSLHKSYKKCFDLSSELILDALKIIEEDKLMECKQPNRPHSYYSYPTKEEWKMFKQNRGRFA